MDTSRGTGSGPRQKQLLVLQSLAQSTPAPRPALVLESLAHGLKSQALAKTKLPPVLKRLARKPRPATDLF